MMKSHLRLLAVCGSVVLAAAATTGCGARGGESAPAASSGAATAAAAGKIAFLMPDLASTRYEQQDSPLFTARMKALCPDCEVIYQNADSDPAKQQQQADSALAQGVKVLVLDAVDTKAAASIVTNAKSQQVPVVTYDRPITQTPADYYVSFDNQGIGKLISDSLVEELKANDAEGGVLIVNGSPTDDAAQLIKKGIHEGVDPSGFEVLAEYDTPQWEPQRAQDWVSGQITQYGSQIVGVVAANDGTGGGSIAAFKAGGVDPVPPVTGNDAEIAAIQRVVSGDQYNTISKPIKIVAEAAAEAAYGFLSGNPPQGETTLFNTPSRLFTPTVVTQQNVKEVIFDGGIYTPAQVCTGEYAGACADLGIQ